MTVAVVILGIVIVLMISGGIWMATRIVKSTDALATERIAHSATQRDLERARFELEAKTEALYVAESKIAHYEEMLHERPNPNADLAPDDRDSRLLRAAEAARRAADAEADREGRVPARTVEAVPDARASEGAGATAVHGPLDPNERLL